MLMSIDSFDPKRQMFPLNESHTYKNVNLKNDTSFCIEEDEIINKLNLQDGSKDQKTQECPHQEISEVEQSKKEKKIGQQKSYATNANSVNQNYQSIHQYILKKESTNNNSVNCLTLNIDKKIETKEIKCDIQSPQAKQQQLLIYDFIKCNRKNIGRKAIQLNKDKNNNNGAVLSLFMLTRVKPKILNYIHQYTSFGRTRLLNKNVSSIVNDSIDYEFSKYKLFNHKFFSILMLDQFIKLLELIENLFFHLLSFIPLFNPENKLRICINLIIACYSCFYLYITSLHIFFNAQFGSYENLFHQIAIAAWISEMLLSMNTLCYHHGQFITDRKQIFKIYVKEYFFFEFLPLIFEGRQSEDVLYNILLHLPLLLKLQGISIIMSKIEFLILQHIKYPQYIQFLKLVFQILFLTHLMACSYYAFGQFEKHILDIKNVWFINSQLNEDNYGWWQAYFEAQYWAFLTMSSSFSMSVNTKYEQIFTSFWMLISCILYAFLINMIGDILREINSQSESFKKNLNVLNRYMKRKKVKIELQREMNVHLKKNYEHFNKKSLEEEKEALNQLGNEMKQRLIIEINKKIVCQFPFFSNKLSPQSLNLLYNNLEEETYVKGEYLNLRNPHNSDPFLYLIIKGEVTLMYDKFNYGDQNENQEFNDEKNIFTEKSEKEKYDQKQFKERLQKEIVRLGVGKCFGEYEFFTNVQQNYIAKCSKKSIVVKIVRSQLIQILKQNDSDYEKFKLSQDLLTFKSDFCQIQGLGCKFCGSDKHLHENCYLVHYSKINPFIISKSNKSFNQERSKFERKKKSLKFIIKQDSQISKQECSEDAISSLRYLGELQETIDNESEQIQVDQNIQHSGQSCQPPKNIVSSKNQDFNSLANNCLEENGQNEKIIQNGSHITVSQIKQKQQICFLKEDISFSESMNINSPLIQDKTSALEVIEQKENKDNQEETQKKLQQRKSKLKIPILAESTTPTNILRKNPTIKNLQQEQQIQIVSLDQIYKNQPTEQHNCNSKFIADNKILTSLNWNESILYWLFDKQKDYKIYFPRSNYKECIRKFAISKKNAQPKKKKVNLQKSNICQMGTINQSYIDIKQKQTINY